MRRCTGMVLDFQAYVIECKTSFTFFLLLHSENPRPTLWVIVLKIAHGFGILRICWDVLDFMGLFGNF